MKIWAVGDLHGHYDQWLRLYKKIKKAGFSPKDDQLIFLGDYIDGGDQSKQVVEWLIHYKKKYPHWQMLYGNHEDLMLDALDFGGKRYGSYDLWFKQGGKETYQSYIQGDFTQYEKAIMQVKDMILKHHRNWLKELPLYYETDKYFFVHAGLVPNFSLQDHKDGLEGRGFTEDPYNRPDWWGEQMLWIRDQFIDSDYDWGKKIIFGHTTFDKPYIDKYKIGIDGMFHNMGNLFALELPEEKIYTESSQID